MRYCKESAELIFDPPKIKHWGKIRSAGTKTKLLVFADFWNCKLLITPQAYQDKYTDQKIFTVLIQSKLEAVTKIKKPSLMVSLEKWWQGVPYNGGSLICPTNHSQKETIQTSFIYVLYVQQPELICSQRLNQQFTESISSGVSSESDMNITSSKPFCFYLILSLKRNVKLRVFSKLG